MSQATLEAPTRTDLPADAQLFRHVKRPEWGVGILAWERDDTRAYQFEDGRLRKIRKGYYKLLESVEEFEGPVDAVRTSLKRALDTSGGESSRTVQDKVCSFDEQVALFTRLYPKGFEDPEWISDHRGDPDGAALKRHREPTLADAREALSAERCAALIAEGQQETLAESDIDLLAGTNLVPISHVKSLRRLDDAEKRRYAESVAELLHGDAHFDERFGAYVRTLSDLLGGRPSWRIATVLPALVHPGEHVSVRRSAFARQAGSIAPTARYSRKARAASYKNFRRVAFGVKKRLAEAGHEPRDMLDVHDFVWTTLRTSALEHLGSED